MAVQIVIRKNAYQDSVTLMALSGKISALEGVQEAVVAMATDMNKDLLRNVGMLTPEVEELTANDLVVAVKADTDERCVQTVEMAEEALNKKQVAGKGAVVSPSSIASAVDLIPESNLVILSVPGQYAAREAMQALKKGRHVMMFSDNVTLADEKKLKEFAHQQGLLMMGPDCGTAIVNNVGLCFANVVNKGNIGVVGASGTGTQEATVLIDRLGGGVSQVLGTGGRDLTEEIGGRMMLDCIAALAEDENTRVILLVSKPPADKVAARILETCNQISKPVIVCFMGSGNRKDNRKNLHFAGNLEEAAEIAVRFAKGQEDDQVETPLPDAEKVAAHKAELKPGQKYVRGLYCGGTLCDEAMYIAKQTVGQVFCNVAKEADNRLADPHKSKGHCFIDMGDDAFTVGKPHPMIEPGLRLERIVEEAKDPETAVLLLDIMIGYGSHPDPAGITLPAILEARKIAKEAGRNLEVVAYVCGTDKDPQGRLEQEQKLAAAGVMIERSNARAARLAAAIVS